MPPDTPVTVPLEDPIVATPVLTLVHVPPGVISLREVVLPAHTLVVPSMEVGKGLTVNVVVAVPDAPAL